MATNSAGTSTDVTVNLTVGAAGCSASCSSAMMTNTLAQNGDGDSTMPYMICTLSQLEEVRSYATAHVKLGCNIDAADTTTWNSGNGFNPIASYNGYFDGNHLAIDNLYINKTSLTYAGLFGNLSSTVDIQNLSLTHVNINGGGQTGALAGQVTAGGAGNTTHISGITVSGTVTGTSNVGGVFGYMNAAAASIFDHLSSSATVSGTSRVGGVVGQMTGGTITFSNASGAVSSGSSASVGGLVGGVVGSSIGSTIEDSYATGDVTAASSTSGTGGLVGSSSISSGTLTITRSYARGNVSASTYGGGLVGRNATGKVSIVECYAKGNVSVVTSTAGGLIGFTGVTAGHVITDSFATGNVSGNGNNFGGLVGFMQTATGTGPDTISRCYATGNISGETADKGGGILGYFFGVKTLNMTSSFATGTVNAGGLAIGKISTSTTTSAVSPHYLVQGAQTCIGASSGTTVSCTSVADVNDFHNSANAPMSAWDFTNIWIMPNNASYPELRRTP